MEVYLTDRELLVFCGLVRLLVRMDGIISTEEREAIEQLGPLVGKRLSEPDTAYRSAPTNATDSEERFWNAMAEAATTYSDRSQLQQAATQIVRRQAQEAIYAALVEIAASDTITPAEWPLLRWLEQQWDLPVATEA